MTTRNVLNYPGIRWNRTEQAYETHLIVNGVDLMLGYFPSETTGHLARSHVIRAIKPKHAVTQPWQFDRRKKTRH